MLFERNGFLTVEGAAAVEDVNEAISPLIKSLLDKGASVSDISHLFSQQVRCVADFVARGRG